MTEYIKEIRALVSDRLDLTRDLSDDDIREVISNVIAEKSQEKYLTLIEKKEVMDGVFNSMRGLDVLQPLVDDPSVTEIMINGPDDVFIEQDGKLFKKNVWNSLRLLEIKKNFLLISFLK